MATQLNNVYLRSGGKLSLAFGTDPTRIYGSNEADVVTIATGVSVILDASFNRGGDTIKFTGNAASYSVVRINASTVRITDALGTSVTIPVGKATTIEFADASRTLSGSATGLLLGDQTVTATPVSLTAGTAPAPVEEYILTSSAPAVTEGADGTKTLTYVLTLNKAPTSAVSVNYQTTDAGTAAAGDDFQVVAGLVTFAAGQTVATVSVTVYGDTIVEADETVSLHLSGSKLVASVDAIGTIRNDDSAPVDPSTYTVTAGDIATANATNVPVTLNIGETGNKTVTIQSDGASANQGIIINGNASATVTSGAAGDRITLSGNGNYTVSTGGGNDNVSVFGSGTNTINVGTGNDTVAGGTGDDTIVFGAGDFNAADEVNGGAGFDTVVISGEGNVVDNANLVGIEKLVFNGTVAEIDASVLLTYITNGLQIIQGSPQTTVINIIGLGNLPGDTLNLSGVQFVGGINQITSNQTGTIILNTTQTQQIEDIIPAPASGATINQQVIVPGVQTVAQVEALIASGVTAKYTLSDTAANLALASVAVFANASSITATTDATAAQAEAIAAIDGATGGFNASATNFKLNVTDTAEQLATRASGLGNATKVTATTAATVAEAVAINTAAASGLVATTLSLSLADDLNALHALVGGGNEGLLDLASSVRISDTVTDLVKLKAINDAIGSAGDAKNVVEGYSLTESYTDITTGTYVSEVNAAANLTVTDTGSSALTVVQANAIEAFSNTGANRYELRDTAVGLNAASSVVVANATSAVSSDATLTVAEINALVSAGKFGTAKFSDTTLTVVGTVAELATLSTNALKEISAASAAIGGTGVLQVTASTTATVAEVEALKATLGTTYAALLPAYAVKDTIASLEAASKVPTKLALLDAAASVAVNDTATVKQIIDLNTKLAGVVAVGYTLQDTIANLTDGPAATIINSSGKVTVIGAAEVSQIDTITEAFYSGADTFSAADLGVKIVYSLRDTASALLTDGVIGGGNGGDLLQYRVGASNISIKDAFVSIADAKALIALKATTKFDGIYTIEANVTYLNTGYAEVTENGGRAALSGAQKVTLVGSVATLSSVAGDLAKTRASEVIAEDTLGNLSSASASFKNSVNGFRIGTVSIATDVEAVNALSAIKPTVYTIALTTYENLTASANAAFVANAAAVSVSGDVTVAKAANLLGRTTGSVSYDLVDKAANLAGASAALLAVDTTPMIDTSLAANRIVNVAQATILQSKNILGYTISDTALNISGAKAAVLAAAVNGDNTGGDGNGVIVNDGGYTNLTVANAQKVYGTNGNATGEYDLTDTPTALLTTSANLVGLARNVTATEVADASQAAQLADAGREPLGTLTFDVKGTAADLVSNIAGVNAARNVEVDSAGSANLVQAKQLQAATNSGTLTYKLSDAGATIADDLLSLTPAVRAEALVAINGASSVTTTGTVNGAQATALAALDKAIVYSISADEADLSAGTVSAAALNEADDITVSGTVTAAFAAKVLAASTNGILTFSGTVTGTSAELAALQLGTGDTIANLLATTTSTVAEADLIVALAASTSTVYALQDTAANLAEAKSALLNGAVPLNGGANNIIATTAATAAEAIKLEAATGTAKFAVADSYSNLMANSDVAGDVDADAALTLATSVTVTDGPVTVAQAKDLVAVGGTLAKYVYSVVDRDAAIVAALANVSDKLTLLNASSVVGENGVSLSLDGIGSTVYIVGTRAELAALSSEFQAASVAKLVVASVADLQTDALYYSTLPAGTSLRVEDTFDNLSGGNSLIPSAASVVVLGPISAANAAVVAGWTGEKVYDLSDAASALALAPSAHLNGATNIAASGTANSAQVTAILGATNGGTTTIAAASLTGAQAEALSYTTKEKITALTVTGTALVSEASAIVGDIKAGNVGSAVYNISDNATNLGANSTAAADARNGAVNITVTTAFTAAADAQRVLSAGNSGNTVLLGVTDTAAKIASLVVDANDTITTISATGTAKVSEAVAIGVLDARTGTTVNHNYVIQDTAANILAAPLAVLDSALSVTVTDAVSVDTAAKLLALNTDTTTITVSSFAIKDSVAALKAAPLAVATSSAVTSVTVTGEAKVDDIVSIDEAFTQVSVGAGLVYNITETFGALGTNASVADGATHLTVTTKLTVGQASTVYGWDNDATYTIEASPTSVASAYNSAHVAQAAEVILNDVANLDQARRLSEMTNLSAAGYSIRDTAGAIFTAFNTRNGLADADIETVVGAKAVSLSGDATVQQLVGTATMDGIASLLTSYTIMDAGNTIGEAVQAATSSAVIRAATKVALDNTVGMTVANYLAIVDAFGSKFVGYDDPGTANTVEKWYYLADSAVNLSVADGAVVAGAKAVDVLASTAASTVQLINNQALTNLRDVTLTGGASAADIATIEAANSGVINGSAITVLSGTAATVNQALIDVDTDPINFDAVISDTGAVAATVLTALSSASGTGDVTSANVTSITGTASQVQAALGDVDLVSLDSVDVSVSGSTTLFQFSSIASSTLGDVFVQDLLITNNTISGLAPGDSFGVSVGPLVEHVPLGNSQLEWSFDSSTDVLIIEIIDDGISYAAATMTLTNVFDVDFNSGIFTIA